jgi:hypothetical protein
MQGAARLTAIKLGRDLSGAQAPRFIAGEDGA